MMDPLLQPCPRCKRSDGEWVHYTWWGGLIGPRLTGHARCSCGATYNGRTGKDNTHAIRAFVLCSLALGAAIVWLILRRS